METQVRIKENDILGGGKKSEIKGGLKQIKERELNYSKLETPFRNNTE